LQAAGLALRRSRLQLEEARVADGLDVRERGDLGGVAVTTEVPLRRGHEGASRGNGHGVLLPGGPTGQTGPGPNGASLEHAGAWGQKRDPSRGQARGVNG